MKWMQTSCSIINSKWSLTTISLKHVSLKPPLVYLALSGIRQCPRYSTLLTGAAVSSETFMCCKAPLTSGSASLCERPTTNTRFLCTTRTLARCFRFSVTFCFFSFCFCFFSFFILWISSCERGLYTAGSSGYG